jgi:hypothetical protein
MTQNSTSQGRPAGKPGDSSKTKHGDKLPNETFERKGSSKGLETGVNISPIQPGSTGDAKAL